jgi:hypothetical protein
MRRELLSRLRETGHGQAVSRAQQLLEQAGYAVTEPPDVREARRLLEEAGYMVEKLPDEDKRED